MHWILYALGIYLVLCYLGAAGMLIRLSVGGRFAGRSPRRLTRLLPGREVARANLTSPGNPSAGRSSLTTARAA